MKTQDRINAAKARILELKTLINYWEKQQNIQLNRQKTVNQATFSTSTVIKEDFDIDRRQFTAEMLSQLATLQKEARNNSQLSVALGCINSMAKIAQVMS